MGKSNLCHGANSLSGYRESKQCPREKRLRRRQELKLQDNQFVTTKHPESVETSPSPSPAAPQILLCWKAERRETAASKVKSPMVLAASVCAQGVCRGGSSSELN